MKILIRKLITRRAPKIPIGELPNINLFHVQSISETPHCAILMKVTNIPGTLEKITDIIAKFGLNIVTINTLERAAGQTAHLLVTMEKCSEESRRRVEEELLRLKDVIQSIHSVTAEDSMLFIPFNQLVFVDRRACIFTQGMLREFYKELTKDPATASIGRVMMKKIGESIGSVIFRGWVSYIVEREELSDALKKKYLDSFSNMFHALGYGALEISQIGTLKYRVELYNSVVCETLKETLVGIKRCGFFNEGVLLGFFREMFKRRVNVEETKCLCEGADYCEYEVQMMEPV